ncbi:alternate-type signal peptide domain-containing protein [Rhodococcus sp. IEGM 1409]|uniref:alternate-type signal peptide domain-containing protein n=1 Tax=Rhodococcus sp. IEGM 1409 TaxID=3047082 RepID=UPI0024B87277|nr:alternate-type signal peptide domain-containing protein [Rhodococcus sp. IEGM 1409]MDI9902176.1 alternate-type signal peptide domain-containing protein [Rhodococcus sp. IEGM 1409]
MKKQTKGAIAAAAAGALLLGGAGSLAVWSDSADVGGGGPVTSGALDLSTCAPVGGGWNSLNPAPVPISDIAAYRIVDTESIQYTCDVTVTAVGDRLAANLTADTAGVVAGPGSAELVAAVQVVTTIKDAGGAPITQITKAQNGTVVHVGVRLNFNEVNNQVAQNQSLNLSAMKLVVTQTPLTAAP